MRRSARSKRQVLENFKYYRVPVIAARSGSTTKEAVCVVFEKVNTGGKALDAFELVTAMYAARRPRTSLQGLSTAAETTERATSPLLPLLLRPADSGSRHHRAGVGGHRLLCRRCRSSTPATGGAPRSSAGKARRKELPAVVAHPPGAARPRRWRPTSDTRGGGARLRWPGREVPPCAPLPTASSTCPYQSRIVPLAAILADHRRVVGARRAPRQTPARWYWNGVFGGLGGSAVGVANRAGLHHGRCRRGRPVVPEPSTVSETTYSGPTG